MGEIGILIRGPSGSGKSTLARRLVEEVEQRGTFARLVADDRVILRVRGGRVIGSPHEATAGLLEIRGLGVVTVPHEPAAVIGLVVDLVPTPPPRLPEPESLAAVIEGVRLARIQTVIHEAADLIRWRIRGKRDTAVTKW